MDYGVVTDNVLDTAISHNMSRKFLDSVTFNNCHTTWNNSANNVPF